MTGAVAVPPRRGTPRYRRQVRQVLALALLPAVTVALGVLSLRAFDLALTGQPWSELSGWLLAGAILAGVVGAVALFDRGTRVVGIFALLIALTVNPLTTALLFAVLGVS